MALAELDRRGGTGLPGGETVTLCRGWNEPGFLGPHPGAEGWLEQIVSFEEL